MDSTDPATSPQGHRSTDEPMPVGAWVRLFVSQQPEIIGFTYLDRQAGFSAKGGAADDPQLADRPAITVRLPGFDWQPLAQEEIARLGLPTPPSWVEEFYGPQPPPGTLWGWWRQHPRLRGRFHPQAPDDLRVLIHDGGPRLTERQPERLAVLADALEEAGGRYQAGVSSARAGAALAWVLFAGPVNGSGMRNRPARPLPAWRSWLPLAGWKIAPGIEMIDSTDVEAAGPPGTGSGPLRPSGCGTKRRRVASRGGWSCSRSICGSDKASAHLIWKAKPVAR